MTTKTAYPPGQEWREPILNAFPEETVHGLGVEGERRINWILEDTPQGQHDLQRIMSGLACNWCLQTFPAPVGLAWLAEWKRNAVHFRGVPRELLLRRVSRECCPLCAKPIAVAVSQGDHLGTIPGKTPVETAAASFFEEGVESRASKARKSRWIRGKRAG